MIYHLAQLNIATLRAPLTDPLLADFVARLDEINALAEDTPGFVWRLKGEGNDATSLRPFDDERIIVNMSVWESIEALHRYAYYSAHAEVYRRRRDWFEQMSQPTLVMWWIAAGHIPDLDEARQRLEHLQAHGPTPYAFTFKQQFSVAEWEAAAIGKQA